MRRLLFLYVCLISDLIAQAPLPGQLIQIVSVDGINMPVVGSSCQVQDGLIYQAASTGAGYLAGQQIGCINNVWVGLPPFLSLANLAPIPANTVLGNSSSQTGFPTPLNAAALQSLVGISNASLIGGTNVTVTGTWPNQTITASSTAATAFSGITGSVNTGQALVVGSNSSLTTTGSGTILATAVPAAGITGIVGVANGGTGNASGALVPSNNLSDLTNASSARTNLGLGSAATQPTSAFDASGAAAAVSATSIQMPSTGGAGLLAGSSTTNVATIVPLPLAVGNGGTGVSTTPSLVAGTNITITGSWPNQIITASATPATAFSALTGSTNTQAAMLCGTGCSIGPTGSGVVNANQILGMTPAASAISDTTNAGNIVSGTLAASRIPTLNQNTTGSAGSFSGSLAGDVTGTQGATVAGKRNGVSFAGLATGILKNTTGTGSPSIAVAGDFPTLNQSTTGNALTATSLASVPVLCPAGQVAQGVLANGNATGCSTAGGSVTSVGNPTVPSWLVSSIINQTTTPAVTLAAASGQASHSVIGTCGSATSVYLCALTLADLPAIAPNTVYGNVTGSSAVPTALTASNLSALLGLGSAALVATMAFDSAGAAAGVLATSAQKTNNLSDLTSASAARTNLGLGTAATQASSAFQSAGVYAGVANCTTGQYATGTATGATVPCAAVAYAQVTGTPALPGSGVVGLSDTQTLTNKSIAGSEINSGTVAATYLAAHNLGASGNGGVTGNLPVTNLNSGTSASATTFWRGDGTWSTPAGSGNVSTSGNLVNGNFPKATGTTTISDSGLALPGSGVVGLSDTQTLTNKSIAGSEINSGTVAATYLAAHNLGASGNGGVTGNLPVTNLNSGTSASATTFWRGDGTWGTPAGGGNVSTSANLVNNNVPKGTAATTIADGGAAYPTGAFVGTGQANTWTSGAQSMAAAGSFVLPTSAGVAPTIAGQFAFDSTNLLFKGGNGASTYVLPWASTTAPTSGQCAGWLSGYQISGVSCGVTAFPTSLFSVSGTTASYATGQTANQVFALNAAGTAGPVIPTTALGIMGDDPTNTSTLGASAIFRKTIYTDHVAGVTIGAGQTTGTRAATCTALNSAFSLAATNGWRVQVVPGVYEIDCAGGLVVTNTNGDQALWITGSQQAQIIQFHANAPGITIGDTAASATDYTISLHLDGLRVQYGVSQTGNTSANLMQIGAVRDSVIQNIWLGADGTTYTAPNTPYYFPAYRAFYLVAGATPEFSNHFSDFLISGAQYRLVDMSSLGTGSVWTNWYVSNGYLGQPGQLSDAAWYLNGGNENHFTQFNIEAVIGNVIINGQTLRGAIFDSVHLETVQLTGTNPVVFQGGTNRIKLDSFEVTGLYFTASTVNTLTASGTGVLFATSYDDAISASNLNIELQNAGNVVGLPLQIFNVSGVGDSQPSIEATNIVVDDFVSGGLLGHISLDPNTPLANFGGFSRISHYKYGVGVSRVDGAVRPITAAYTVYGQDVDPTIQVPASITSLTLTLSDVNAASGPGSTAIPKVGNIVHVRRDSGSASGTLTIADAGAGILATSTAAAADLYFKFDGVRYRVITDAVSFATGGSSSGNATSIQGIAVSAIPPTNNQSLIYNSGSASYVPASATVLQSGLGTVVSGTSTVAVNIAMTVRAVTATADTLTNTDCGGLVTYTNAGSVSVAVPQAGLAGNFVAGCPVNIRNYGASTVTLTPSVSTIGGASNSVLSAGASEQIVSDGTNYQITNIGNGSGGGGGGFANPMTTLGDMLYENATPAAARLAGSTSSLTAVLTQTGTGSVSAAPAWSTSPTLNGANITALSAGNVATGTLAVARGGTGVSSATGTGNAVLSNSPVLVSPALGTPTSGTATNLTGLPLTTGVTGTLPVANGGTGNATLTPYTLLAGGTTSTGAAQQVASVGTAGQVLTSNGAGALPSFQAGGTGSSVGPLDTQASTSYTIPTSDCNGVVIRTANSSMTDTLSTMTANCYVWIAVNGSGSDTVSVSGTLTVNGSGATSYFLASGQYLFVVSQGSGNYSGIAVSNTNALAAQYASLSGNSNFYGANTFYGRTLAALPPAYLITASLASASTIAPTTPVVHVTGTSAISTMTPYSSSCLTTGGGCQVRLIADGAWTISAGTSTGQFKNSLNAVVGTDYSVDYDNATGLWYAAPANSAGPSDTQSGASYSIPNSDCNGVLNRTYAAGNMTDTIGSMAAGCLLFVFNNSSYNSDTITFSSGTGTITGNAGLTTAYVAPLQFLVLSSTGSGNYVGYNTNSYMSPSNNYNIYGTLSYYTAPVLTLGIKPIETHGSNATSGMIALSSGTATVSTTAIAALATSGSSGDAVRLTLNSCSSCGTLNVGTVTAGTSFVIHSSNASDASVVLWEIVHLN